MTNARIFKANAANGLWFIGSLLISEIPIFGSIPAITVSVWRMYSVQIKKERAELKKYQEERAAIELQERRQQAAYLMQMQAAQEMQAANDELYVEQQQEAANDAEYPQEIPKKAA